MCWMLNVAKRTTGVRDEHWMTENCEEPEGMSGHSPPFFSQLFNVNIIFVPVSLVIYLYI